MGLSLKPRNSKFVEIYSTEEIIKEYRDWEAENTELTYYRGKDTDERWIESKAGGKKMDGKGGRRLKEKEKGESRGETGESE